MPSLNRQRVFYKKNQQGRQWIMGRAEIDQDRSFIGGSINMKFIGIRGSTFRSDIAIDDFCTAEGPCGRFEAERFLIKRFGETIV